MYRPLAKCLIFPSLLSSTNAYHLIPIKLCHKSLNSYPYYPVLTTSKCLPNLIYFGCLYPGDTRNAKGRHSFDGSEVAILPVIADTFHAKFMSSRQCVYLYYRRHTDNRISSKTKVIVRNTYPHINSCSVIIIRCSGA